MTNDTLIKLDKICSCDYAVVDESTIRAFLHDISLEVKRGDAFGIFSDSRSELQCLTQIIANVRPYEKGKAVLGKIGMMQKKNLILPHLFYVAAPDMLPLECTPITLAQKLYSHKLTKEQIEQTFEDFDMTALGKRYGGELTDNEKMVVQALLAYLDGSEIVVLNLIENDFLTYEIEKLAYIVKKIAAKERCVVVSTLQAKLIGICCHKTAYIVGGQVAYLGSVEYLTDNLDRVRLILVDDEAEEMYGRLTQLFSDAEFRLEGNSIFVMSVWDKEFKTDIFLRKMAREKIEPSLIRLNKGRVQNSFEEISRTLGKQSRLF